jgi:hypothetical protein
LKIIKTIISYKEDKSTFSHAILLADNGHNKTLLSYVNIYLRQTTSRSLQSTNKYADNLKRFFEYLLKSIDEDARSSADFWLSATETHIHDWQGSIVKKRDDNKSRKPSDKTIRNNASLIKEFFNWSKLNNLPTLIRKNSDIWKFNFKKHSTNKTERGQIVDSTKRLVTNKKLLVMSKHDITNLQSNYSDPVFAFMHTLALATGLREEGLCQFPYIGVAENNHIRPYSEMELSSDEKIKVFDYTVTEKGSSRTLKVNSKAWKAICAGYLSLYFERRRKFKRYIATLPKNERPAIDSVFFLNKKGHPVTPKMISSATNYAKSKIKGYQWVFHDSRGWYATSFMMSNLTNNQINSKYYDLGVEEVLRKQIGHKDIKTTYTHYLKVASLILATNEKMFDYTITSDEFWGTLTSKALI